MGALSGPQFRGFTSKGGKTITLGVQGFKQRLLDCKTKPSLASYSGYNGYLYYRGPKGDTQCQTSVNMTGTGNPRTGILGCKVSY